MTTATVNILPPPRLDTSTPEMAELAEYMKDIYTALQEEMKIGKVTDAVRAIGALPALDPAATLPQAVERLNAIVALAATANT